MVLKNGSVPAFVPEKVYWNVYGSLKYKSMELKLEEYCTHYLSQSHKDHLDDHMGYTISIKYKFK